MRIFQTAEVDPFQILRPSAVAALSSRTWELTELRGEQVNFRDRQPLFLDFTLAAPDGAKCVILMVERREEEGVPCYYFPALLAPAGDELLGRLADAAEAELAALLENGAPLPKIFAMATNIAQAPVATASERMLPGISPYGTLLSHLQRYRFAASHAARKSVLDLGCGAGYGLSLMEPHHGTGIDLSAEAVALAKNLSQLGSNIYRQGDVTAVDLSETFDVVTNFEVIEHLADHHALFDTAVRHLKPEGAFIISLPNPIQHGSDRNEFHLRDLNSGHFAAMLGDRFADVTFFHQAPAKSLDERYAVRAGLDPDAEFWLAVCRTPKPVSAVSRPLVSIVMPVFNKLAFTQKAIESVRNNSGKVPFELIVVDNASSDGTAEYLASLRGTVKAWRNEENLGFARATNQGALLAHGDFLVFLNNDTEVQPGWLNALVDELTNKPQTGIVGGRLLYPDGTIQHAGVAIGRDQIPFHIHHRLPADHPLVSMRRSFPVVTAACAAVRRLEFYRLGMLDEEFVNGHEDIDLCLRYGKKGQEAIYRPDCVVVHHESVSDGRMASRPQNLARTFRKWRYNLVQDDFNYAFPEGERQRPAEPQRIAIKIGTPDRTYNNWGDIYFAECLAKSLCRLGHHCEIHYLNEWGRDDLDIDLVVHLKGLSRYIPKPYHVNVMWMLNHPTLHTIEELSGYDAVLVASLPHAEKLRKELSIPVLPFLQATDPEQFRPLGLEKRFDLVFVGNNNGADRLGMRQIIADLLPTSHRLAVWGAGWEDKLPEGVWQGEFVPWHELPMVYNSSRIVLNDHQPEMKSHGFVNNRTFDAAACGAIVVSDSVAGMDEVLPVFNYKTRDELQKLVDDLLSGNSKATSKIDKLRQEVVQRFSFDLRAQQLLQTTQNLAAAKERVLAEKSRVHSFRSEAPPLVSILMSTYNRRRFLPAAIASIQAQHYPNWELIIVNDGGEAVDNIVANCHDPRLRLVSLAEHRGKGHAINRGFEASRGEFIAHLDDDDIWYPDHLERLLLPLMTIPGLRMAYTDAYDVWLVEQNGKFTETERQLRYSHQVTVRDLVFRNFIQGIVVMHDRRLFQEAGGMDEHLQVLIDWDLWRRLAVFAYPYHVSRVTADHYLRESEATSGTGQITNVARSDKTRFMANQLRVLRKRLIHPALAECLDRLRETRRQVSVDFLMARGEKFEAAGKTKRTRAAFSLAAKLDDTNGGAIRNFALFELSNGAPEHAFRLFLDQSKISDAHPIDMAYALLLARHCGKIAEAETIFSSLEGLYGELPEAGPLLAHLRGRIDTQHSFSNGGQ